MSNGKYFGGHVTLGATAAGIKEQLGTAIEAIADNAAKEGYVLDWALTEFETSTVTDEMRSLVDDGRRESYNHLRITVRGVKA